MNNNSRNILISLLDLFKGDGIGAVLARGSSGVFVVKVIGAGIGFLAHIILARFMGAGNYGIYIYVFSWMTIFSILGSMGFNTSALRFVASYQANKEWGALHGFLRRSRQIFTASSIVFSVIAAATIIIFKSRFPYDLFYTSLLGCLLMPIFVSLQMHGAYLQGLKKVIHAQAPLFIGRPLLMILGAFTIFLLHHQSISSYTVMSLDILATTVALLVTYKYLRDFIPEQAKLARPIYHTNTWIKVSFPLLLIGCFEIVIEQTDIVMLGMLVGTTESGLYAAASKVSTLISFGFMAVNVIAAPMISELYSQGKIQELHRLVKLAAIGILAIAIPVSIIIIIWGESILGLFGQPFIASYYPLVILSIGQLVNSLAGTAVYLMTMTGHQREVAIVFGVTALVNIILNLILIPVIGMVGAAIATSATLSMWNIVLLIYVKRKLKINPTILPYGVGK